MLGIAIRSAQSVRTRSLYRAATALRDRTASHSRHTNVKVSVEFRRWQSSAAARALQADKLEETLPTTSKESEASSSVVLRPYQEAAITSCLEALSAGLTRIGVSSPTGSGKTTMFMSLIPKVGNGSGRTLILVSSVDLASQAEMAARRMLGPSYSIEVEQGKRQARGTADV